MGWLWWVGGALTLGILEMLSLDLVLVMFAGGALAGALAYALGAPVAVQILVAALTAIILLATLRPWLLRHLKGRVDLPETNAAALVGRPATVVSTVDGTTGRVKLVGEVWTARTADGGSLPPGTAVTVTKIDGATAVVSPAAANAPGDTAAPGVAPA
ncbi:NfeD family protein [Cellulomonas dongxiuzhuiae]|uniref:NfeD family protein n=1 Tax=Cellulomonas dongxiuzhuiae TaxID=2819979 RepID=A0ABX8GGJ6_9CELL|nr:NfeD family protein [Cellulomonas dongxiuzhuiae]MBO3086980.1 NfeD family protein [Cellulomonas dongxiuzhuiae]MBO3093662.1 NfeD family protein [Cellulomonas dongxiuzhuiae]QWC14776.1 NfeD family protein [Cellulomonas dongxiuzhuiae]